MAVLVVDDDATVVNLVTAVLHRAGIEAEVAMDGPGALQRLGRGRYRAVLSDLTMPGMSGLQLLREARARGHALPFLIMTAYLPPETETALRIEPGVAGVLRKPFDIKRLVSEVRALLQSADPGGAALELPVPAALEDRVAAARVGAGAEMVAVAAAAAAVAAELTAATAIEATTAATAEPAATVATVATADAAAAVTPLAPIQPVAAVVDVGARFEVSAATTIGAPLECGALLPVSLMEFVSARLRRQALLAQAERRAAALLARPAPLPRSPALPRPAEPMREAELGC